MASILHPRRWGRPVVFAVAVLLVLFIGLVDYATNPDLVLSIFYVVPVALAAWYGSRTTGLSISVLSATTWFLANFELAQPYSHPFVPYFNALTHLGLYVIATLAMSSLHAARQAEEELTRFIVHDLRSPLVTLQMALDSLREEGLGEAGEQHQRLLDIASISGGRMMPLVNSLLDLSRLEQGRMPVRPTAVTTTDLVEASLEQVALWAESYGVTLRRELAPEPRALCVDTVLTERVLVNLLSNAIKHSPAGSTIVVGSRPDGPDVVLTVSDEGPGVPEAWLRRVFDRYVQVESNRDGAALGTGLGLAFCRLAVEAQGGRIRMENRSGGGASVVFTLPLSVNACHLDAASPSP